MERGFKNKQKCRSGQAWWPTTIIPVTQEDEAGGFQVANIGNLMRPCFKPFCFFKGWDVYSSVLEYA